MSVGGTWSDNINLSGVDPVSDFVTEIIPGIAIAGEGGRVTLDFDYQLGLVDYARNSSGRRFNHRLQFHSIVCGFRLGARQLPFRGAAPEEARPASSSRVPRSAPLSSSLAAT